MSEAFNYEEAFSRNLGWVTPNEQERLKNIKVAIGGAGGVGGIHLITLVRLGLTRFHLSDPDTFEIKNFNRQYGANMTTIGQPKCDVMAARAKEINPDIHTRIFPQGITPDNVAQFLDGVDIYVDGLDVFAVDVREFVVKECRNRNIPFVTVAPVGMGASVTSFTSDSMSFEDYFGTEGKSQFEKTLRFILGLTPSLIQLKSLVAREFSNVKENRVSSTSMGCAMASGIMGTEVLKLALKRGKVVKAPRVVHYDGYLNTLKKTNLWFGNKNPIFQLKLFIMKSLVNKIGK